MPLQLPTPPRNAYKVIAAALSRLSMAGGAARPVANVADPSKLNCALPHKVYTLGSNEITRGRALNRARLIAWRFLIQDGPKTVAAIELSCDSSGGNLQFASLDTGPFAQATRDLVERAEQMDTIVKGSYELRGLKMPSVYVMAAWFKNLNAGEDIVMPIDPSPHAPGLASGGGASLPQSPAEFMQGLKASATKSLQFDSSPKPAEDQSAIGGIAPPEAAALIRDVPDQPAPQESFVPAISVDSGGGAFNRQVFIKSYANLVARTWIDDTYLQLVLAQPAETLAQAGMPTNPGAVIRVIQHFITGMGKIEDQVDAWLEGDRTGLYDLYLPFKPEGLDISPGGGAMAAKAAASDGGNSCCCSPCCCCT